MLYTRVSALFVLLAVSASHALCVGAATAPRSTTVRAAVRMQSEDPTANPFIQAINSLQEAIQNSPAANFKEKLAKMQAGDYDKPAVSAKLESLISDNGAVMFSFTT